MAELTLNEYISRLEVLSQKADADGKHKVSEFTLHLLNHDNPDLKVLDAIFKYYDSISDNDTVVYNYFIEHNANVEWFYFAGFLSDQRGNIADYFEIIKKCFEAGIKVEKLYSFEKQSNDMEKFAELVENELANNQPGREIIVNEKSPSVDNRDTATAEYIHHLVHENNILNKRLDTVFNELNGIRSEQKDMMEASISDKHVMMDYKVDNERLRKEVDKAKLSLEIAKRKFEARSSMIEQLNIINSDLVAENSKLKSDAEELTQRYKTVLQECTEHTDTINDLNSQIKALQSQLKEKITYKVPENVLEQSEYDRGFGFNNEETVEPTMDEPELESDDSFVNEPEELDYDPEELIEIKDNKKEVKKHSNFLVDFIARHFEKKFINKSIAEQDNLIFIKLMENEYKQETVRAVKSAMKNNQDLSRVDLYKLVTSQKSDDDILVFCKV